MFNLDMLETVDHAIEAQERSRWEIEYEAFCREQAAINSKDRRPFILYPRGGRVTHRGA